MNEMENVLVSALNQYCFCPRRCALIYVEGIFEDNEHTVKGSLLHDQADTPGYETTEDRTTILRALPLFSKKHGLVGKADIVEMRDKQPTPVEYKKGRKKQWGNDDIQLCAQVLCLEEMFDAKIAKGFIYHAGSKKRREVFFDESLRKKTIETIDAVRQIIQNKTIPAAVLLPHCDGCSLRKICVPELTGTNSIKTTLEYNQAIWQNKV